MNEDELLKARIKNKASQPRTDRLAPVKSGPSSRGGSASPKARLRAATGTPEAVVKVISFASTKGEAQSLVDYVTRKGELDLELKDGSLITDREGEDGLKDTVDFWALQFRERARARNAMHVTISTPEGTDEESFRRLAQRFGKRAFGEGLDYGFVVHNDSRNPHAHFVVVRDGEAKNTLGWNKKESQRLRDIMVEEAEKQGISLNATRRYERGRIEKSEPMAVRKARDREGTSNVDYEAALEVLRELKGEDGPAPTNDNWTSKISENLVRERAHYEELASAFGSISGTLSGEEKASADLAESMVKRQAMALRQMATRRDHMQRLAVESGVHKWPNPEFAAKELARTYREDRTQREKSERHIPPASHEAVQKKLDTFVDKTKGTLKQRAGQGDKSAEILQERLTGGARSKDKGDFEQ